jgi:hypothetical protein
VSDCVLSANTSDSGGGILNSSGTVTVTGCTLSANSARGYFGRGGAIGAYAGDVMVTGSALAGNSANQGGGIYFTSGGRSVTVTNSTLAGNFAAVEGGGIWSTGRVTVKNSTLAANSAPLGGGVLTRGSLTLTSAIVAGNLADGGPDVNGAVAGASSYDLVGIQDDTLTGISDGVNHNQIGSPSDPLDPGLSPLGYYGGPTATFALLPGSPARDAGDPTLRGTDQRGQPHAGGSSDIGAFQSQPDPFLVTTLADPGRQSGVLSLREAVALANVLPGDHTVSFADALDGGAVRLTAGQLELSGTGGVTTIDGASRFTLDGGGTTRLVQVDPGTTAVLRGLALVNGNAPIGAGVFNRGTLMVADCVLYGNVAYSGGAVLNQGDLTVAGCTLGFNVATIGGAIDNEGLLTAYNSTLLYNAALAAGGAILNQPSGTAILTSLTVSLNSADTGGGLDVAGGMVLLRNCIVAGNYTVDATGASDVAGAVDRTSTYNLIGIGGSGGLLDGVNHNLVGVADPGLTTPDFSGPQTPAFGLSSESPALGAGDPTLLDDPLLSLDQHGNVRTVVNIGAV